MAVRRASNKEKLKVAQAAKRAGFSEQDVASILGNKKLNQCIDVIERIEQDPRSAGVSKKKASEITRGGRTIISNSSSRMVSWITRRKIKDHEKIERMIELDIASRCKKLLGDPLKRRIVRNLNERTKGP